MASSEIFFFLNLRMMTEVTAEHVLSVVECSRSEFDRHEVQQGAEILSASRLRPEHLYEVMTSPSASEFLQLLPLLQQWRQEGVGGIVRFTGPMRGGKTLYALAVAFSIFKDDSVLFAKSAGDMRDPGEIRSNAGLSSESNGNGNFVFTSFDGPDSIESQRDAMLGAELLVLDEVLFCSEAEIALLRDIAQQRTEMGKVTIVSSLDKDFRRQPMVGYLEFESLTGNNVELVCRAKCEVSGLPFATVTQRMISQGGNGWYPARLEDPVIIAEMPGAEERYGPRVALFHRLAHELDQDAEEEVLRGMRVLAELDLLLDSVEQRVWMDTDGDMRAWQQQLMDRWFAIRDEAGPSALTRHEIALLIKITEIAIKRERLLHLQHHMPYFKRVYIDGGLGVGKSTLIKNLQAGYGVPQVREDVTLSRWIASSIGGTPDEKRQSAELAQLYYRVSKIDEMLDTVIRIAGIRSLGGDVSHTIVVDRSLYPGDEQFIQMHIESGNIEDRSRLDRLLALVEPLLPREQYFVFLTASPHRLQQRQLDRDRAFERALPLDFLTGMQDRTHAAVLSVTETIGVPRHAIAVIDTDQLSEEDVLYAFLRQVHRWQLRLPEKLPRL